MRQNLPTSRRCASVDKGNNIAAILEIVRLAMKINASEKTEVQAFVSISPHISEVQVDIYNSGWSYDTYPNVTYRARYDFSHQDDETMTNYIPELKITNVNCNVDYMQKKLCELRHRKCAAVLRAGRESALCRSCRNADRGNQKGGAGTWK